MTDRSIVVNFIPFLILNPPFSARNPSFQPALLDVGFRVRIRAPKPSCQ